METQNFAFWAGTIESLGLECPKRLIRDEQQSNITQQLQKISKNRDSLVKNDFLKSLT